jgi:hypothetical protein
MNPGLAEPNMICKEIVGGIHKLTIAGFKLIAVSLHKGQDLIEIIAGDVAGAIGMGWQFDDESCLEFQSIRAEFEQPSKRFGLPHGGR